MQKLMLGAMLAAALVITGCSGCTPIQALTSNTQALGQGQKIDEQVMGSVSALGSSANVLLEAAAKSGLATRPQLLVAQEIRRDMDAAHAAALAAYNAGDAVTFNQKLAAVSELNKKATALFNEVKN